MITVRVKPLDWSPCALDRRDDFRLGLAYLGKALAVFIAAPSIVGTYAVVKLDQDCFCPWLGAARLPGQFETKEAARDAAQADYAARVLGALEIAEQVSAQHGGGRSVTDDERKMLESAARGGYLYDGFDFEPGLPEAESPAYKAMASLIQAGLLDHGGRITTEGRLEAAKGAGK